MKKIACMVMVALFAGAACAQELGERVVISSAVGDTLRLSERNRFGFFQDIGGFNWAMFFLTGDSIVNAKVDFDNSQGVSSELEAARSPLSGLKFRSASRLIRCSEAVCDTHDRDAYW